MRDCKILHQNKKEICKARSRLSRVRSRNHEGEGGGRITLKMVTARCPERLRRSITFRNRLIR